VWKLFRRETTNRSTIEVAELLGEIERIVRSEALMRDRKPVQIVHCHKTIKGLQIIVTAAPRAAITAMSCGNIMQSSNSA
jgi:hypothetical protein